MASGSRLERMLPLLVLAGIRLFTIAALPLEALTGYGDYEHFYNLASLSRAGGGLPWIDHWVEFPPLFPFFSVTLYSLVAGRLHAYVFALAIGMALFDVGNLWLFGRLAGLSPDRHETQARRWMYLGFLAVPAFGFWTFEPAAVFLLLLGLLYVVRKRTIAAGLAAGAGALVKAFPVLILAAAWNAWSGRVALRSTVIAIVVVGLIIGGLVLASPDMASASLAAQGSKGSWETIWALIDGNLNTGLLGPLTERSDPQAAYISRGNPARIPHWIPTLVFSGIGALAIRNGKGEHRRNLIGLTGLMLTLIFLWSPGWSPQWIAYLIPLLLLTLPLSRGGLLALALVAVSLLEWPILLSRGQFDLLWIPVLTRTALIVLAASEFWQSVTAEHE